MHVVISGTASTRLSRVQRTLPDVTTFEAGILTDEELDAASKGIYCKKEWESAGTTFKGSSKERNEANDLGHMGQPDRSAIILLSPPDLCKCGLFSCDVIQVLMLHPARLLFVHACMQHALGFGRTLSDMQCHTTGVKCYKIPRTCSFGNRTPNAI